MYSNMNNMKKKIRKSVKTFMTFLTIFFSKLLNKQSYIIMFVNVIKSYGGSSRLNSSSFFIL